MCERWAMKLYMKCMVRLHTAIANCHGDEGEQCDRVRVSRMIGRP